jgi:hypothetical protein
MNAPLSALKENKNGMDNYTDRPDDHAARNDFLVDTALRRHRRSEKRKITPRVNAQVPRCRHAVLFASLGRTASRSHVPDPVREGPHL